MPPLLPPQDGRLQVPARRTAPPAGRPEVPPGSAGPPRLRTRSAQVSTNPTTALRESRRERPRGPCPKASPDRGRRNGKRPTPPIRLALRRRRTQTYRTDRARWCAAASQPRPSRGRIEPARCRERLRQVTTFAVAGIDAMQQKIAVVVDPAADLPLTRHPAEI